MFKRPHSTKSSNLISNSARKKLTQQAKSDFFNNNLQTNVEHEDQILQEIIPTIINVTKAYTHLGDQLLIYHDHQHQPIWIKLDKGTGRLVPTVYTLLKFPSLLPILRTNQMVLEKLTHGADLMIPGLIQDDLASIQDLKKDTLISIVPTDSVHLVWAVGLLAADGTHLVTSQSGKAVVTVHARMDYLWNSGTKEIPNQLKIIPSISPTNSDLLPARVEKEVVIEKERTIPFESIDDQLIQDEKLTSYQDEKDDSKKTQNSMNFNQSCQGEQASTPDVNCNAEDLCPSSVSTKLSSAEVDHILKQALLTSLWNQQIQSEIPMPGSQFYSTFILPFRHFECPKSIGVKDSSARNLAKWLKNMNKLQFITIKEDHKKRTETLITGVNLDHPELEQFRKYRTIHDHEKFDSIINKDDNSLQNNLTAIDVNSCLFQLPETKLNSLFRSKKNEGGWFWLIKIELDPEALYTHQELKENLNKYISTTVNPTVSIKRGEVDRKRKVDMSLVEPDDYLRAAMGNPLNSELRAFKRSQILDLILSNSFIQWWRLERNQILIEKKGDLPCIILKMKKKSGSKQATLITGLEFFGIDPIRFAKELKTLCAGSTTTRPIAIDQNGYNKILKELLSDTKFDNLSSLIEVECQGDQRNFLSKYLTSNTPISKNLIVIM